MIPAFLAVDVEPDDRDPPGAAGSWSGVDALFAGIRDVKAALARRSGHVPHVTWYLRMDPQIEQLEGRPDHIVHTWGAELARLERDGDSFGIHPHPLRYDAARGAWITDLVDERFHLECLDLSAATFEQSFGAPPHRHRYGDGFLSQPLVDRLVEVGVAVDLTLEPGLPRCAATPDDRFVGTFPSTRALPRSPYRPAPGRYAKRGAAPGAPLMIPISATTPLRDGRPWWWRAGRAVRRGLAVPDQQLYPWLPWSDASVYWDKVAAHLAAMERPYLAIAVRTDAVGAASTTHMRRVLDGLAEHELGRQLRFVDPYEWGPRLAEPSGAR